MPKIDLSVQEHHAETDDGWVLRLRRTYAPTVLDPAQRPLLIVPGYGMNSFIFGYHPRGTSMERCLAEAGLEVWSVDLRGQGGSRATHGKRSGISLERYARGDLPAAVRYVLEHTRTDAHDLVLVGASLGGSIAYAYLATTPDHGVGELIAMGAPLRWEGAHPVLRMAFASETVAGALRMSNTRALVRAALPLLLRAPGLLSMYMNTQSIDLDRIQEMVSTVEDPLPRVNRDIARWLRAKDLDVGGVNVTDAMGSIEVPLLVVLSNRDGIVPAPSALSAVRAWGGDEVEVLEVGDERDWYAHANLFIANCAPEKVFAPIVRWLRRRAPAA
ncbi:MAG: alpha/beta hydrolase [Polyangiaceae bacterium]|nr:alpha/beta hydrolase [Polyangiaceae bacterium]